MENDLENKIEEPSIYDFTRKSVVGAVYRVGASFAMDAVYLSLVAAGTYYTSEHTNSLESMTRGFSDFVRNLDSAKLARVTAAVVAINFIDYKFDITDRLDGLSKKAQKLLSRSLGIEKRRIKKQEEILRRKHQGLYQELKSYTERFGIIPEDIKTREQFQEKCNWLFPAKIIYLKTKHEHDYQSNKPHEDEDNVVCEFKEGFANNYEELTSFINKQNLTDEGFLGDETFLDYFYEWDPDKRERMEDKFSFKIYRKNNQGKLWINQENYRKEQEIYLIEKI